MIDTNEYLASLEAPSIKIDGDILTGHVVDFDEGAKYEERLLQLGKGELDSPGVRALLLEMCDSFGFPAGTGERICKALPGSGVLAVMVDFSKALQGKPRIAAGAPSPATPAPSSASAS